MLRGGGGKRCQGGEQPHQTSEITAEGPLWYTAAVISRCGSNRGGGDATASAVLADCGGR